jgi:hypothetical protein
MFDKTVPVQDDFYPGRFSSRTIFIQDDFHPREAIFGPTARLFNELGHSAASSRHFLSAVPFGIFFLRNFWACACRPLQVQCGGGEFSS